MSKRTLEEKIKDAIFWTVIFFIMYLIIGYLLESLWLSNILKLDKLYELLKDALGITAAFLAPVAAFVLFSDWREEHQVKSAINLIDEINNKSQETTDLLKVYYRKVCLWESEVHDEFKNTEEHILVLNQLEDLKRLELLLDENCEHAKMFKENIRHLAKYLKIAIEAISAIKWAKYNKIKIKEQSFGVERFENEYEFYTNHLYEKEYIFEMHLQLIFKINEQNLIIGNLIKKTI